MCLNRRRKSCACVSVIHYPLAFTPYPIQTEWRTHARKHSYYTCKHILPSSASRCAILYNGYMTKKQRSRYDEQETLFLSLLSISLPRSLSLSFSFSLCNVACQVVLPWMRTAWTHIVENTLCSRILCQMADTYPIRSMFIQRYRCRWQFVSFAWCLCLLL